MTQTDENETIYAVYLAARERPQPPEYAELRDLFPGGSEATIDAAADAATLGAIHGAGGGPTLSPDELDERLAAKNRALLDSVPNADGES
ncbi:MAG TPA: hypothetical protein VFJ06_04210 [Halococcus sp.]|nr:hypothetical protein [Halococcus sp.]